MSYNNKDKQVLTERQKIVLETMRLKLSEEHSLIYLSSNGYPISDTTFYREKNKIVKMKLKRLYNIAQVGFQDQHLESIDQYEMGFKMMWQNVLRESNPYKQNIMIKDILLLKPYLSAYYEATKLIVEKQPIILENKNKGEEEGEEKNESKQESSYLSAIKRSDKDITGKRFNNLF